jgi:DNA-directed RNA polymerase subunit RPC12/RpoP
MPGPDDEAVAPPDEPTPPPSPGRRSPSLQAARRELMREREMEIRDVGGLALEMARRDAWNPDLLATRTGEVLAIEERIAELDSMLVAAEAAARGLGAERCVCGAPIVLGAHFCSHCGRPATETPPLVTCSHCGRPLPADVIVCPACGHAVAAEEFVAEDAAGSTLVEPAAASRGEAGGP